MVDPTVARLHEWLKNHESELLQNTLEMLRIESIEGEPARNAPFGAACRQALDLALGLCKDFGMRTVDLEGFIGYGEFGKGERLIVSLGHLDVVPVGPGWKHAPFGAEIDQGYIYARGAVDDKGPTMASLYAMRAIKECMPDLAVRMRPIFGCNEESGFKCLHRYNQTEEAPAFGVAPDSGWPLYHAEKGISNLHIEVALNKGAGMELVDIKGGQRPNIVIDRCEAAVRVKADNRSEVESKVADRWDRNIEVTWKSELLHVVAQGKAAHGSTPFLGDSAATRALRFLFEIAPVEDQEYFETLLWMSHPSGVGLGISGSDEPSRDLTANLGIASAENGSAKLLVNVRYPVTWTKDKLEAMCKQHLATLKCKATLELITDSKPLYFDLNHPLVKAVVDAYREETGDMAEPGVMGGGTYARAIANTVSIGTGWEGDGKPHETDERLKVEHLFKMSRIYAHIFYRLATLP